MRKIYAIFLVLHFVIAGAHASETRCSLGEGNKISVEYINLSGDTAIDILFPKVKKAKLKFVRLWYGKPMELFVELPFIKDKEGYLAEVTVNNKHEPVKLSAIYHYQVCYAEIEAIIENGVVRQAPNT